MSTALYRLLLTASILGVGAATYTAAQAASDITIAYAGNARLGNRVRRDVKRNALAAIKNGKTENLAPFVNW